MVQEPIKATYRQPVRLCLVLPLGRGSLAACLSINLCRVYDRRLLVVRMLCPLCLIRNRVGDIMVLVLTSAVAQASTSIFTLGRLWNRVHFW